MAKVKRWYLVILSVVVILFGGNTLRLLYLEKRSPLPQYPIAIPFSVLLLLTILGLLWLSYIIVRHYVKAREKSE